MKKLFSVLLVLSTFVAKAQTAKVYRGGALIGTYSDLPSASYAANQIGDSIWLSADTFKIIGSYIGTGRVPMFAGQTWQGTMTATDSTIIDGENKSGLIYTVRNANNKLVLRDIIFANGFDINESAFISNLNYTWDSNKNNLVGGVRLMGNSIVRNCHATQKWGVATEIFLLDNTKVYNNSADSAGGIGGLVVAYDNAEISYNKAYVGGVGGANTDLGLGGGNVQIFSTNVKIHHNKAMLAGGVVMGTLILHNGQALFNEAPVGALAYVNSYGKIKDAYIYNPGIGTTRQNEIYIANGKNVDLNGAWFGDSDTTGLIISSTATSTVSTGKYAIANWRINRGKTITKSDTFFPLQAAISYQDGTPIPAGSYTWLRGNFTVDKGTFTPSTSAIVADTISSLYRTYYHSFGDTGAKPVNFVCNIDLDTFRATRLVWGKANLSINDKSREMEVMVYPNPASEVLHIQGAGIGSSIALYDVQGRLVKSEIVNSASLSINIADVAAGNYILKIRTKEGAEGSAKIVKE